MPFILLITVFCCLLLCGIYITNRASGAPIFLIGATNRPDLLDSALLRPGRLDRCVYLGTASDKHAQEQILKALTRKFKLDTDIDMTKVVSQCPMGFTGADMYALASDAMLVATKRKIEQLEYMRQCENDRRRGRREARKATLLSSPLTSPHTSSSSSSSSTPGGEGIEHKNMSATHQLPRRSAIEVGGDDDDENEQDEEIGTQAFIASLPEDEIDVRVCQNDFLVAMSNLTPSLSADELAHYAQLQKRFQSNRQAKAI